MSGSFDSRRWIPVALLGSAIVMSSAGCGSGMSRRIVTVYSPHGQEILSEFEKRFETTYPEIDVRWTYMSSQIILERLQQERANPTCDVWWGSPSSMFDKAASQFLLERYRPTWADHAAAGTFDERGEKWFGTFLSPEVLFFNRNTLSREEAPKDWDELLDPKWAGKIVLRSPMESGTMRSIFSAMIWKLSPDHVDINPNPGYEWLQRLHVNTGRYLSSPELLFQHMVRSSESLVSMWLLSDIELQRNRYDYPFDYVVPPKTPVLIDGIAIVSRSLTESDARKEDARLFYEFVTSQESLIRMANPDYYRIPARIDIPPEQLPSWLHGYRWDEIAMDVDWSKVALSESTWMEYWQSHIYQQGG